MKGRLHVGAIDAWNKSSLIVGGYRDLATFGAPLKGLTPADFLSKGFVRQAFLPSKIDILTSVDRVNFAEALPKRQESRLWNAQV